MRRESRVSRAVLRVFVCDEVKHELDIVFSLHCGFRVEFCVFAQGNGSFIINNARLCLIF